MNNETILAARLAAFNKRVGPRVGDFLALAGHARCPSYTRFAYDWGDQLQTGGLNGSYYLGSGGCLSYSGSLDHGIAKADCLPADEVKPGSFWIFDRDIHQAYNGVNCEALMRVFKIRPGADTSGIKELKCPYFLVVADDEMRKRRPYLADIKRLRTAIEETLEDNAHLADGDNCTLIKLKRAITPNK